ncbi:MAG: DNA primase [Peptococcia bacterium]
MPGQITEEFIDDLRNRVDIVDIIKEYVPLKKQGQNYKGLCPFHSEKTPSFVVSPHKQIYHCFGCGKGGNVYTFLMDRGGLSFLDAVAHLAQRCGIPLPQGELTPEKARQNSLRERYYHINEMAVQFFQQGLEDRRGQQAKQYLQKRGINNELITKFSLGYAPDSWDELSRFLLEKEITEEEIILLGLAVKGQRGNLVDRFRNRVMFPIFDDRSHVIGFGGRVMDDTQPKYLNSPDTPLFSKGRHLYGLNLAKTAIRSNEQAILMEGYMDVLAAHQYGITHAVGTLGTALTADHGKLLMRYTYNAVLCFDADAAGQEASMRGLDTLRQLGMRVSVMTVPDGKDPDEFLRKNGRDSFQGLIEQALSLVEYKLTRQMAKYNKETVAGKVQIIQALLPDLYLIQSPVERQGLIDMLAQRLSLAETAIYAEMKKYQLEAGRSRRYKDKTGERQERKAEQGDIEEQDVARHSRRERTASEKAQYFLTRVLLENPEMFAEVEQAGGKALFSDNFYQEIYQVYYLLYRAGHNIKAEDLITQLENEQTRQIITEILLDDQIPADWGRIYKDCLLTLQIEQVNHKITEKNSLMIEYEKSGNVTKSLEIMAEVQKMIQYRQSLVSSLAKGGNTVEK